MCELYGLATVVYSGEGHWDIVKIGLVIGSRKHGLAPFVKAIVAREKLATFTKSYIISPLVGEGEGFRGGGVK